MSHYNKQQTVHLLPLPFDIGNLINSFLFQEIKTVIENKKKEIVKKFESASISRKNDDNSDADTIEHWAICLTPPYDDDFPYDHSEDEIQFQAINCQLCGNYKISENQALPEKIKCYCCE